MAAAVLFAVGAWPTGRAAVRRRIRCAQWGFRAVRSGRSRRRRAIRTARARGAPYRAASSGLSRAA
ncbi:hypothetical protein O3I_039570 [Nocardia brasiliensis ATCC 700358]|uniref:Uncharacterized protein n=1 Tax=Nocardia brasiliensis (strain ATCC 700358 / HUJEG-1) TaxID=1133849 RepID=K0FDW2_NOCB7|nr:hypothetical protein O3I_039570 [Nocardia brasiliensis ATCC 700358]